jgi:hypothetical protein
MRCEEGFSNFIQEKIIAELEKVFKDGVDELHRRTLQVLMNFNLFNFASSYSDDNNKSPIDYISDNLA